MADSARTEDSVAKITQGTGESAKNLKSMAEDAKTLRTELEAVSKLNSNTVAGKSGGANASSSSTPTTASFGSGGGGGGLFGSGQTPYQSGMPAGQSYSGGGAGGMGRSFASFIGKGLTAAFETAIAGADMLPTTQEAVYTDLYRNRLGFYGSSSQNIKALNAMGTATSPLDALMAAGSGAAMGLLPGLDNYMSTNFGGITGGAALLSNLVPGAGLQAGMTGMAALNQAGNVNRLRMLGINVRNKEGTGMNSLPQIIEQLYAMLQQSAGPEEIKARDIAISAMSGNALDSILNQYFPGDPTLRQGIIAGLIQRAATDENLARSGTQARLVKTGGMTGAAGGIAARNAAEYGMIEGLTDPTLQGMNRANEVLRDFYNFAGGNGGDMGPFASFFRAGISTVAQGKAGLETLSGGRSGAVGGMFDALGNAGGVFGGMGTLITSLASAGLQAGALLAAANEGRASTAGTINEALAPNIVINNNINTSNIGTEADAKTIGITIGNEINKELLLQLAAAKM